MNIKVSNPNFSIVTPNECDSGCHFCFSSNGNMQPASRKKYVKNLQDALQALPDAFRQISITGGEPSTYEAMEEVLSVIDKKRYPKLVFTTSATKNGNILDLKGLDKIDHINISRHAIDDAENRKIFDNEAIPDKAELTQLISDVNMRGIDVTLNCILKYREGAMTAITALSSSPQKAGHFHSRNFIMSYIDFAKEVNASACSFRKCQTPSSNLTPTTYEQAFGDYTVVDGNECPVCRSSVQYIKGMRVIWRASLFEPSNEWKGIYELIYQPNATVTSDWAGEHVVKLKSKKTRKQEEDPNIEIQMLPGCGSGGSPTQLFPNIQALSSDQHAEQHINEDALIRDLQAIHGIDAERPDRSRARTRRRPPPSYGSCGISSRGC